MEPLLFLVFALSGIVALLLAIDARRLSKLNDQRVFELEEGNARLAAELEKFKEHSTQKIIAAAKLTLEVRDANKKLSEEVTLLRGELAASQARPLLSPQQETPLLQGASQAAPPLAEEAVPALEPPPEASTPATAEATSTEPPTEAGATEAGASTLEASPEALQTETAGAAMPASQAEAEATPAEAEGATTPGASPARAASATQAPFDWEGLVGVKLFSWLAGIALSIAAVFLIRYSLDQSWFTPTVRVVLGLLMGVALLVGGESKMARQYAVTANSLEGSGVAILYITLFGASAWWKLIPPLVGFGLAAVVTALGVFLAYRHGSFFIGVLGLVSGFAAPALFSTGQDNAIGLFAYLLLLNSAFWWLTYRKQWPGLLDASVLLTALYQWGWLYRFFSIEKLSIAVGAFLLFPVLGYVAFWRLTRGSKERPPRFLRSANLTAVLPLGFALFLILLAETSAVDVFFYSLLAPLLLGYFVVRLLFQEERLHLLGALCALCLLAFWGLAAEQANHELTRYAALLCALFYLLAPRLMARLGHAASSDSELAALCAPALLFFSPALETTHISWLGLGLHLGLGLAICLSAKASARSVLYACGISAAILSLLLWEALLTDESWPMIVMLSAAPFVLMSLLLLREVPAEGEEAEQPWWSARPKALSSFTSAGALFGAQALAVLAGVSLRGAPLSVWLLWYLVLVLGFFWHSIKSGWGALVLLASLSSMVATYSWPGSDAARFLLGLPLYAAFLLFPLFLGRRSAGALAPGLSAVVASAGLLWFGFEYVEDKGLAALLFVGAALLLGGVFFALLSLEPEGQRRQPHLALLAAASLLMLTIATPLRFHREVLAMAWSVEGVLLLLLYRRVWHRGLPALSAALFGLVVLMLGLNPEVLLYYPRTETPLWNWFLYCYPFTAATLFIASALCWKELAPLSLADVPSASTEGGLLLSLRGVLLRGWGGEVWLPVKSLAPLFFASGVALLFVLLNIEIADFFSEGSTLEFRFFSERVAEGLAYTLGWAAFALGLLVVGIVLRQRATRIASIVILLSTTLKCFLLDLGNLGGLYRVGAFVGLAFALAGVALLLQRFVLRKES